MLSVAFLLSLAFQDGTTPPAAEPKKLCRVMVPDTGSRLGRRKICKTREEWQESDRAATRDLRATAVGRRRD